MLPPGKPISLRPNLQGSHTRSPFITGLGGVITPLFSYPKKPMELFVEAMIFVATRLISRAPWLVCMPCIQLVRWSMEMRRGDENHRNMSVMSFFGHYLLPHGNLQGLLLARWPKWWGFHKGNPMPKMADVYSGLLELLGLNRWPKNATKMILNTIWTP